MKANYFSIVVIFSLFFIYASRGTKNSIYQIHGREEYGQDIFAPILGQNFTCLSGDCVSGS
ncbi:hypothetical protein H5410_019539 [Solanum commersonii]|uniref:Uncharacterized protein n=1 Tax=Solanum commersonii TaxID=4109 RepID=A0A9J5Z6J9_SOLCO|nr:hypothetical protein H5410_019539 [Solanum commersonii]